MRKLPKNWCARDLALLIGFRALGKDFEFIARRLGCSAGEAKGMLRAVRPFIREEVWLGELLDRAEHRVIDERDQVVPQATVKRAFRVSPHFKDIRAAQAADIMARIAGDPEPRHRKAASKEV